MSRKTFVEVTRLSWGKGATPVDGRFVIARTKKGQAIMVPTRLRQMVTGALLREMLTEARGMGLTGDYWVYGSATLVGGKKGYHFVQINASTGAVLD